MTPDPKPEAAVYAHGTADDTRRLPAWLRRPLARTGTYAEVDGVLAELGLDTVCQSAKCPNRGECFSEGTATFLIMGDTCTRDCRFCAVESRAPLPLDPSEPQRVAEAARRMGLSHVVITSVTRDDVPDGGAAHFAATVKAVRDALPDSAIEVLTSDFAGDLAAVDVVAASAPDVFNHNLETVPRLYATVRPQADIRALPCRTGARRRDAAEDSHQVRPDARSGRDARRGGRGHG